MTRRDSMGRRLAVILAALAVVAASVVLAPAGAASAGSATTTTTADAGAAPVAPSLRSKAAEGEVRVIAVTTAPGDQVVDDVLAAVPESSVTDVEAGPAPQVVATVDAEGLDALSQVPGVTQVVEDKINRMVVDTWPTTIGVVAAQTAGWDGAGRTVAVLDAGVQSDHPFLAGRVLAEGCFSTNATGIESLCAGGVTQLLGSGAAAPCVGVAGCAHGTHVAGLAVGGPVVAPAGLTGAAQGASLVTAKVFSKATTSGICGGAPPCLVAFDSDIVAAMTWIKGQRQLDTPGFTTLDAVNLSLGGGRSTSTCDGDNPAFTAAVNGLRDLGVLTVAATGNNGLRDAISSPACISTVVSVGATTGAGSIASYSNLSPQTTVVAPGSSMTSSIPPSTYGVMSGTSMATPVVSGAIAALRQKAPTATAAQLVTSLTSTGAPIAATVVVNAVPTAMTFPEVRLDSALATVAATVPSAPQGLTLTSGLGQIAASWAAPAFTGTGFAGYSVTTSPAGGSCSTVSTSCLMTGLTNGVTYRVSVTASNTSGSSGARVGSATPAGVPGAPTSPSALAGDRKATVSWVAPASNGGSPITGYLVTASPGGQTCSAGSAVTSCVVSGLPNAVGATFTVVASNTIGAGPASVATASVLPKWPGSSPFGSIDVVTPGFGQVVVGGWAIDPDTPTSIGVQVALDGVVTSLTANTSRPDVDAAFGYGAAHGYSTSLSASPGPHTVCVTLVNVLSGSNSSLGCRVATVPGGSPFGSLDAVSVVPGSVSVSGWAIDPDVSDPVQVQMYLDGSSVFSVASGSRPDVGSAFPGYGPDHGFSMSLPAAAGPHTVCVYALNVLSGSSTSLGCRVATVPGGSPFGSLDSVSVVPGSVSVSGWAIDPDVSDPVQVQMYLDGSSVFSVASGSRPDVGSAFPGYGPDHGFSMSLPAAAGPHTVCVYALNVLSGSSTSLGCRVATVPGGPPFGSLDSVVRHGDGSISASGWVIDPDVTGAVQVLLYVAGNGYPLTGASVVASESRPDVGLAYPLYGAGHGFTGTVGSSTPPNVSVCVYALDTTSGGATTLGCRTV